MTIKATNHFLNGCEAKRVRLTLLSRELQALSDQRRALMRERAKISEKIDVLSVAIETLANKGSEVLREGGS